MLKPIHIMFWVCCISACSQKTNAPLNNILICDMDSFETIEQKLKTSDSYGHGPDIGSNEWKSVVEFKLGVRGETFVPPRSLSDWCKFIDSTLVHQLENN